MNCIIVDDEHLAQDVLAHYIDRSPGLQLIARLDTAMDLFQLLHKRQDIDLIFLDIQMPELSGLDLVRSLKNLPVVVFTTAYHEHAVAAFDLNVADYLLKPFSYERFLQAVSKVIAGKPGATDPSTTSRQLFIKSEKKLVSVHTDDILYVEGLKNYFVIVTSKRKKIIVHNTLSYFETSLQGAEHIIRIHRSFFVNLHAIKEIAHNMAKLADDLELPIGQMYRDLVMSRLRII